MYCKKCGTKIDSNSNYCPSCGNPQNNEKKKHTALLVGLGIGIVVILLILSVIIKILAAGINGNTEKNPKDSTTTAATATNLSNPELYEYKGYVKIDYDSEPYADIERYLPSSGVYHRTFMPEDTKMPDIEVILSVSDTEVLYENYIDNNDTIQNMTSYGRYRVSVSSGGVKYCEKIIEENILGSSSSYYELLEPDSRYELSNGKTVGVPTYAYTVTVPAGTFENCICMITWENIEADWASGEQITLDYYAPSVGKVFSFSMGDYVKDWSDKDTIINYELVRIESSEETTDTPIHETNGGILPESTDNTVELSNGLSLIMPESWLGMYEVIEGAMYYSFYEKSTWESDSDADGYLFGIWKILSCEELNYYPESKILGVYQENGEWIGLLIDYPSDVRWDVDNEEQANNYHTLSDTLENIVYDTSDLNEFVACDENTLSDYLPLSLNY